jgi:hypothetical protein
MIEEVSKSITELEEEIEKLKSRRFQDFLFGFFCGFEVMDLMWLVFSFIKYILMR